MKLLCYNQGTMITRYTHGSCTWIDLVSPSPEEVREVMEEHEIAPQLVSDLTAPVPRSEAIAASGAVKVTLDFPVVKLSEQEIAQEVKFILTKDALITVHYADIAALHQFGKEFEVSAALDKDNTHLNGGHLFLALINTLYVALERKLDYVEARLTEIEQEIFREREKEMVVEISRTSQRVIMFRQALQAHEQVLQDLAPLLKDAFGNSFAHSIDGLETSFQTLTRRLGTIAATITELRETNNSLITTKQNEIMKNLTIMAFITFPLSLFTSMFGMNTKTLPLAGEDGDFWMILAIMIFATIGFFIFFKHKRWM